MKLKIARWRNSLAVRLPIQCTRAVGLKEGDCVEASITGAGEIKLAPEKVFEKTGFLSRLAKLHASMPITDSVVGKMRRETRY